MRRPGTEACEREHDFGTNSWGDIGRREVELLADRFPPPGQWSGPVLADECPLSVAFPEVGAGKFYAMTRCEQNAGPVASGEQLREPVLGRVLADRHVDCPV